MIVKVQRSIAGNMGIRILIYDETGETRYETGEPAEVQELMDALDGDIKAFFEATLKKKKLVLGRRVEDQAW